MSERETNLEIFNLLTMLVLQRTLLLQYKFNPHMDFLQTKFKKYGDIIMLKNPSVGEKVEDSGYNN